MDPMELESKSTPDPTPIPIQFQSQCQIRTQEERRQRHLELQLSRKDKVLDLIHELDDTEAIPHWDLQGPRPIPKKERDVEFIKTIEFIKRCREFVGDSSEEPGPGQPELPHGPDEVGDGNVPEDYEFSPTSKINGERFFRPHLAAPCKLMLSEWLDPSSKPGDLDLQSGEWLGVLCPVGKRVLVIAARGKTRVFSRRSQYLGFFKSNLPGGKPVGIGENEHRGRGVTILDCIWSEASQTFYVLDLIAWNSWSYANQFTEGRSFFLNSKITEETPELGSPSLECPFKFVPLCMVAASKMVDMLTTGLGEQHFGFPEEIDGLLLYHKQGFYIHNITPLVLWVLLPELSQLLGITPCPEIIARCRPERENPRYYLKKPETKKGEIKSGGTTKRLEEMHQEIKLTV